MGLYIENEIEQYWSTDSDNMSTYLLIRRVIARDYFK